jgi:hypothetical protein
MFHILSTVAFILNVFLFSRQATWFAPGTKKKKWKTGEGRGEGGAGSYLCSCWFGLVGPEPEFFNF